MSLHKTLTIRSIHLLLSFCFVHNTLAQSPVEFNRDVRPILSSKCFYCHGPDETHREADLRLDKPEAAISDRGGYAAIVPGDIEASEAIRRISSEEEYERMPPPESGKTVTKEEMEILERWINQGAEYEPHWAFQSLRRPILPSVNDESWVREPIDRFVLSRLETENATPAPVANRYELIRRVSLDLTGLPPDSEEVQTFVENQDSDAYVQLVERLISTPQFGERMTLAWLDASRYADTNGYSIDGGRQMWLWRDWVIQAFNRNKPYDEFLLEQIAGDLLSNPTQGNLIATGFQRNNMVTHEGGTIPEENLTNYNADRVKTLGEAVLGLTLGCAQCHDHKFDPISHSDYYRLFAYFNTLGDRGLDGDGGINPEPTLETTTVLETDELPELQRQISVLKHQLANPSAEALQAWETEQLEILSKRGASFQLHPVKLLNINTPNAGAGFTIENKKYVHISQPSGLAAYDVSMRLPDLEVPITGLRIIFLPSANTPGNGLGFGHLETSQANETTPGTFMLTAFSASTDAVQGEQINLSRLKSIEQVTASSWITEHRPENALDLRNYQGWSPDVTSKRVPRITFTFQVPIETHETPFLTAQFNFGYGRNLVATRFQVYATTGTDSDVALPSDVIEILQTPHVERTESQHERIKQYYSKHAPATWSQRIALNNLLERKASLTSSFSTMVMNVAENPRETFILNRGDYSQPTLRVEPGVPSFLPPLPANAPPNRLGLAKWLTMRSNPLTARVAVNRCWQIFFGTGLVDTPSDFGSQGSYPTNPELLDWLAIEFIDSGWDMKHLIRMIVNSATYRQSSRTTLVDSSHNANKHLLTPGPRFRLPAEFIRDSALKVSGLLVNRVGGPSVNPYTPGDLWREVSHYGSTPATAQTFVQDHGEKLYRRSLYTYWKRTVPPPSMAAFDAPNRETCIISRAATNTPLQALVLLNDVQFIEAARAFAERIILQAEDDRQRLRWAFLECLARPPKSKEIDILMAALERERLRYSAEKVSAEQYLSIGESQRNLAIAIEEHAAWSQIATILLNLSETLTRN